MDGVRFSVRFQGLKLSEYKLRQVRPVARDLLNYLAKPSPDLSGASRRLSSIYGSGSVTIVGEFFSSPVFIIHLKGSQLMFVIHPERYGNGGTVEFLERRVVSMAV